MAISEVYTGTANATLTTASQTSLWYLLTGATHRAWITGLRISIGATSNSSGQTLFQLIRCTSTNPAGGTTTGAGANDPAAPANLATFGYSTSGSGGFSTAPTLGGAVLWQQIVPFGGGSSWEEFPPGGYEYTVPISSAVALAVTGAGASSTTYYTEVVWSD